MLIRHGQTTNYGCCGIHWYAYLDSEATVVKLEPLKTYYFVGANFFKNFTFYAERTLDELVKYINKTCAG